MEIVIEFDFEADARNFALLQSLYKNVDIFSVLQKYMRNDLCATKFPSQEANVPCYMYFMMIRQNG